MPPIHHTLLAAYRATDYAIATPQGELVAHIGQYNPALAALHAQCGAAGGGYLTAYNPYSQTCDDATNTAANARLQQAIERAGLAWLPCDGRDPDGHWPAEPGFWVLAADRRWLCRLGRQFRQNALVFAGPSARPRLICLR